MESSSDEIDVLLFDWDEMAERCGEERLAVIQQTLDNGEPQKAQQLVDCVYNGGQWPEEVSQ